MISKLNIVELEEQLNNLTSQYSQEDLLKERQFELSVGAKSALGLLNSMEDEKFYQGVIPRKEIIWVFRLFFQYLGRTLDEDDSLAWDSVSEFLTDIRNKEKHQKQTDKVLLDTIATFDFSDDNIDKIELLINGQQLDPQQYTETCALSGLLMFTLREASVYSVVTKGKLLPSRQYKRLLHKISLIKGN